MGKLELFFFMLPKLEFNDEHFLQMSDCSHGLDIFR